MGDQATIHATFDDHTEITVFLDADRDKCARNLTHDMLIAAACEHGAAEVSKFLNRVFG